MTCCSPKPEDTSCTTHAKQAYHAKSDGRCIWGHSTCAIILAGLGAAVAMYLFEIFWHGQYLMPIYDLTPNLWRTEGEMENLRLISGAFTLVLAMGLSFLFSMNYENGGVGEGIRFGIAIGVLLGILQAMTYIYLPISFNLATLWFFGWIVEGTIAGIALSLAHIALQKKGKC